ncbi:MAG: hypothetical protein JWO09_2313 [Bacteroidetes bacterium]|nr:hypothetical protein [Bacteroidota bacterium]
MRYLISGLKKGDWQFNTSKLSEDIKNHWLNATIRNVENESTHFAYSFNIPFKSDELSGDLHKSEQFIGFEGDIEACAEFAKWIVDFTKPMVDLMMYDQGYNENCVVNSQTKVSDIVTAFS